MRTPDDARPSVAVRPQPLIGSRSAAVVIARLALVTAAACWLALQGAVGRPMAPIALTIGGSLPACAGLARWTSRRRGGSLVYVHHLVVVLGVGALSARCTGAPVTATTDVVAVGMLALLAVGRVGCHLGGCCHGRPTTHGVVYEPAHFPYGSQAFAGVPLAPVQLAESAAAACLALATGAMVVSGAPPGASTATVLVGYGVVRIVSEAWRGDPGRAHLRGLPHGLVTAAALVAAGSALAGSVPDGPPWWFAGVAGASTVATALVWFARCRGTRLATDDLLLAAGIARNAATTGNRAGRHTSRSGVHLRPIRRGTRLTIEADAAPPLSDRDVRLIDRTVAAVLGDGSHRRATTRPQCAMTPAGRVMTP